jgi:alanine racemase
MEAFDLRLWPGHIEAGLDPSHPHFIDQVAIDSRRIYSDRSLFVALKGIQADGHDFIQIAAIKGAKYAIVKNDWIGSCSDLQLLKVPDPLKAFQAIAKAYRLQMNCKVIAITGSYGKTMVKDLLLAFLETSFSTIASPESFNSQIGVPLSLLTIRHEHRFALIEAAISEFGEIETLTDIIVPDFAILTHIGKKHVGTLGSLETTACEMAKILKVISKDNWIVVPNDPFIKKHLSEIHAQKIFWNDISKTLPHAISSGPETYQIKFPDDTLHEGKVPFGFSYFIDLLNLAIKPAWKLGIPFTNICHILDKHTPEPMRTEIWQSTHGATFINDSYCSDPQSVDVSLKYFNQFPKSNRKIFLFGGMRGKDKHDSEYKRIGEAIEKSGLEKLILVGNTPLHSLIESVKFAEVSRQPTYESAFEQLKTYIKAGDTILVKGEKKQSLDTLTSTFNDSICTNQCFINLAAIRSNLSTLRKSVLPKTRIMVMVKAEAYGTNNLRLTSFLKSYGIDMFGVSYVDEAVALRSSGITESIFTLNAAPYEASKVVKWDLEVGLSDKSVISAIENEASKHNKKIKVHLHVDTGMSRLGCRPEEALQLAQMIHDSKFLQLEGILTHLACADDPKEDAFTLQQIKTFDAAIKTIEDFGISIPWKHACNSSAIIRFNFTQYNMVRTGLAIFGLYSSEHTKNTLDLRLAVSLTSRIVGINHCIAGETISYGRNYMVERENQNIAVIPIGYYDGLHRNYSGKGYAIIRGHKAPMVGTICMDYMMLDVTDIPGVVIGDTVLIFGEDEYGNYLPPEELATSGNSIIYELMTCLGPRIQRIFIYEEAKQKR